LQKDKFSQNRTRCNFL